jgi:hypothetical protein
MNEFVTARGGWITSLPGDVTVRLACSPISSLPDDLRRAGYDLTETGEGQRIRGGGIDATDRVHRDTCGHLQGETVRLRYAMTNVGCRGNSGKHWLGWSFSAFDPRRTIEADKRHRGR